VYIDSKATDAAQALQKLGGAQVILATAPSSKAMSELIDGLGPNGKLMVVGAAAEPIEVTPVQLIFGCRTIEGWAAGPPAESEDTLRFAELSGVRPMVETYPLDERQCPFPRGLNHVSSGAGRSKLFGNKRTSRCMPAPPRRATSPKALARHRRRIATRGDDVRVSFRDGQLV
jgi:D-arabinose 1-dehydrogenase-like Zn-dependent alcohol dehydrogenase